MKKHELQISEANLDSDRDLIIAMAAEYINPKADGRRFDWLYRANPFGLGKCWIARESGSGEFIGMASAIPRIMYVGAKEVRAWVLADFCIKKEYRSLGPALALQRTCISGVEKQNGAFWYDFPSKNMLAIYRRLGINSHLKMSRFAKVLRIDRKSHKIFQLPLVGALAQMVGNSILWLRDYLAHTKELSIVIHTGPCQEEFSYLMTELSSEHLVITKRSADYLNWRYLSHPSSNYRIIKAYRRNLLVGYGVLQQISDTRSTLIDLVCANELALIREIMAGIIQVARELKVGLLDMELSEMHPWYDIMTTLGFWQREASLLVFRVPSSLSSLGDPVPKLRLAFMAGERDW